MTLSDRLSTELIDTVIKADVGAYTEKELQAYLAPGQVNFLTRVRDKLMHDIEADLKRLADKHLTHAIDCACMLYPVTECTCDVAKFIAAIEHYCDGK